MSRVWAALNRSDVLAMVMAVLGFASCVQIAGLAFLFAQVSDQAHAGAKARQTQCDREPVMSKVADAAYAVRHYLPHGQRITAAELRRFHLHAPRCP